MMVNAFWDTIVKKIINHDEDVKCHPAKIQFLVNVGIDKAEEIYSSYTNLFDLLNQESLEEETGEQFFQFKDIIAHQWPRHLAIEPTRQICEM